MERFVTWLMEKLGRERFEIGRRGLDRYLTRWTLWGKRANADGKGKVFLHLFHRGDAEPYNHDHPWPFWSLILWGGYWEVTECTAPAEVRDALQAGELVPQSWEDGVMILRKPVYRRKWYGPFRLLRRPAEWRHRAELPEGKRCWTLIWTGPKIRSWGFWCPQRGWINWREHEKNQEAGQPGCGE